MNIAIAKVIIQEFVNNYGDHLAFKPGEWVKNSEQIINIASEFGETEIIELVDRTIEMGMAEHMFKMEEK